MRSIYVIFTLLCLGTACIQYPSENAAIALDTLIDRPLVVGMRMEPAAPIAGSEVMLSALAIAPLGQSVGELNWSICGYSGDEWTQIWDMTCFQEESLVKTIGHGSPIPWTIPQLPDSTCGGEEIDSAAEDFWGCSVVVPLMASTETDGKKARAAISLNIFETLDESYLDVGPEAEFTWVSLGEIKSGATVEFQLTTNRLPDYRGFRWYIDAGTLLDTGRTSGIVDDTDITTRNRLVIPDDFHGTLRVFVVFQPIDVIGASNRWTQYDVEVP